mgnify:CR=1 FL=1
MKFSFELIKKLAPGKYNEAQLAEGLNLYSFEAVDLSNGVLEISVPPNRFSDAASHIGIAREAAAILNLRFSAEGGSSFGGKNNEKIKYEADHSATYRVNIKEKDFCIRYMAAYASHIKIGHSPKWLQDILESCGLRPINNVVDIMNYVMLETGQPMHAFDAEKVSGGLIIRKAQKGEKIQTIDDKEINLNNETLIIADSNNPLAIAGIKGGKSSEIGVKTTKILVESANFDNVNIYRSSRKLNLRTDASMRFSHNLSPELAEIGMKRALILLKDMTGARIYKPVDIYPKKQGRKLIKFDVEKIKTLIGEPIKEKEVISLLKKLGFNKKGKYIEVYPLRNDIMEIEDLAEEIARLKGYENLKPIAPAVALGSAQEEDLVILKDKIKNILTHGGYSEVYNYSLISKAESKIETAGIFNGKDLSGQEELELSNPISKEFAVLRGSLVTGLLKNLKDNARYFNEIKIFEIGKAFRKSDIGVSERTILGAAVISKNAVLDLKGLVDFLFQKLGITEYNLHDFKVDDNSFLKKNESLKIELDGVIIGYLGSLGGLNGAILEINLEKLLRLINEDKEFAPLSKFPSIIRDISLLVDADLRVGRILETIDEVNHQWIQDVDLIDWYQDEKLGDNKKSLTFRIVFQVEDRTLTDAEVDKEMAVINQVLIDKFNAELR